LRRAAEAGSPRRPHGTSHPRWLYRWLPGIAAVAAVAFACAGVAAFATSGPRGSYEAMGTPPAGAGVPDAAPTSGDEAEGTRAAAVAPRAGGASLASHVGPAHAQRQRTAAAGPLPSVVSVSPRPGLAGASLTSPIVVQLSSPPRHGAPMPSLLSTEVHGSWSVSGRLLVFRPKLLWVPWATVRVTIPASLAHPGVLGKLAKSKASAEGGPQKGSYELSLSQARPPGATSGLAGSAGLSRSAGSAGLAGSSRAVTAVGGTRIIGPPPTTATVPSAPVSYSFTVQGVSLLRAQQLLAELKYLPLRFGPTPLSSSLPGEANQALLVSPLPERGVFTWRYPDIPASLAALWSPGQANVVTQGAVMRFEDVEGLPVDGVVGPQVWRALTAAVAARRVDPDPYDYLMVSKVLPESLVVWRNGKDVFSAPVNTGVYGAVTPDGTWPVYEHLVSTTMSGTDPDGYHYVVPNVPWVAYFYEGDAVHGYWRASYGWPQSNGCVELPVAAAAVVWPMDPLGTLVNVSG
jgi:peptidoglycan hydrolase-like protein with peptidoglycan-binding domain